MSTRDDRLALGDILTATERIMMFAIGAKRDDLGSDELLKSAILYQLSIIGEAAKQLSTAPRSRYPEVKWKQVCGMRDRIVHGYFELILDIIWETVASDIPQLRSQIQRIVSTEYPE